MPFTADALPDLARQLRESGHTSPFLAKSEDPSWSDPQVPLGQRVGSFLKTRAGAIRDVASDEEADTIHAANMAELRDRFGVDPDHPAVRQEYGLAARKVRAGTEDEGLGTYILRRSVPFGSTAANIAVGRGYQEAKRRYDAAQATPEDLNLIARYERWKEGDAGRSTAGEIGSALAGVPAIAGEVLLGGRLVSAGAKALAARGVAPAAAGFIAEGSGLAANAARGALATPITPSAYLPHAQAQAEATGTGAFDVKNLAPALALGAIQNAVLGQLQGKVVGGNLATRVAAKTAVGLGEQQAADIGTSALDDAVRQMTGTTLGLSTRYGTIGSFVRGDDDAWKRLAAQAATFAVFAGIHSGAGHETKADWNGTPTDKSRAIADNRVIKSLKEAIDGQAKKGVNRNVAVARILGVHDQFENSFAVGPESVRSPEAVAEFDARMRALPKSDPVRQYGETLAEVAKSAPEKPAEPLSNLDSQPEPTEATSGEQPEAVPEVTNPLREAVAPDRPAPREDVPGGQPVPAGVTPAEPPRPTGPVRVVPGGPGGEPRPAVIPLPAVVPPKSELATTMAGKRPIPPMVKGENLNERRFNLTRQYYVDLFGENSEAVKRLDSRKEQLLSGAQVIYKPEGQPPETAARPALPTRGQDSRVARMRQASAQRGDVLARPPVDTSAARSIDEVVNPEKPEPIDTTPIPQGAIDDAAKSAGAATVTKEFPRLTTEMYDKAGLDTREREVIERRLNGETQASIAREWNVSRERVRQIEAKLLGKLGVGKSVEEGLYKAEKLARSVEKVADGEGVDAADLHSDHEAAIKSIDAFTKQKYREAMLDSEATQLLVKKEVYDGLARGEKPERIAARLRRELETAHDVPGRLAKEWVRSALADRAGAETPTPVGAAAEARSARETIGQPEDAGGLNAAVDQAAKLLEDRMADRVGEAEFRGLGTAAAANFGTPSPDGPTLRDRVAEAFQSARDEYAKLGGSIAPRTTSYSEAAGNRIARYISSAAHAQELTPNLIDKVMGDMVRFSDRVRVGGVLVERRLRHMRQVFLDGYNQSSREAAALRSQARQAIADARVARSAGRAKDAKLFASQAARFRAEAAEKSRDVTEYLTLAREVQTIVGQVPKGADPLGQEASPFQTESEYQAALADPDIRAAVQRWDQHVVPVMNENYKNATGVEVIDPADSPTQIPGSPVNLKAWRTGDGRPGETVLTFGSRGRPTNTKEKRLGFAEAARGNAEGYDLDVAAMIENSVYQGLRSGNQAVMYKELIDSGLAVRGRPGQQVEIGGQPARELPNVFGGKSKTQNPIPYRGAEQLDSSLYLRPDVYGEVRQALKLDEPYRIPVVTPAMRAATSLNVALSVPEVTSHTKNLLSLAVKPGVHPFELVRNARAYIAKDPVIRDRIAELAGIGALKPSGFEGGHVLPKRYEKMDPTYWTGKFLDVVDRSVRLTLDDAFTRLVRQGRKAGGEANRRNFVNQAGQYNAAAQQKAVAMLRDTGIGPFATAASNFWVRGLQALTGASPGRATSARAELGLRAEAIGRVAAAASAAAVANYLISGNLTGDRYTPLGAVKVDDDKGKVKYFDLVGLTGLSRGVREIGLQAAADAYRRGTPGWTAAGNAASDIAKAAVSPAKGPLVELAYEATPSRGDTPKVVKERLMEALWHLNSPAEFIARTTGIHQPKKESGTLMRVSELMGPFGVKERAKK